MVTKRTLKLSDEEMTIDVTRAKRDTTNTRSDPFLYTQQLK
jgi:hypothetical protein